MGKFIFMWLKEKIFFYDELVCNGEDIVWVIGNIVNNMKDR